MLPGTGSRSSGGSILCRGRSRVGGGGGGGGGEGGSRPPLFEEIPLDPPFKIPGFAPGMGVVSGCDSRPTSVMLFRMQCDVAPFHSRPAKSHSQAHYAGDSSILDLSPAKIGQKFILALLNLQHFVHKC